MLERQQDSARGIGDITREHILKRHDLACEPDETKSDRYADGYAAYRRAVMDVAPLFEKDGA